MDSIGRVRVLDEAVCVSIDAYTLWKDTNPPTYSLELWLIQCVNLRSFGKKTGLREDRIYDIQNIESVVWRINNTMEGHPFVIIIMCSRIHPRNMRYNTYRIRSLRQTEKVSKTDRSYYQYIYIYIYIYIHESKLL